MTNDVMLNLCHRCKFTVSTVQMRQDVVSGNVKGKRLFIV